MKKKGRSEGIRIIIFGLVAAVLPLTVQNGYYLGVLNVIGIYTLVAIGLCLLIGYAGQISFSHAAFYGIGAYTSAILTTKLQISPWLGLPAAGLVTGLAALIIGLPALKLKHHFLALATLSFGFIVHIFFVEWVGLTGGPSGILDIPAFSLGPLQFKGDTRVYYLIWLFAVIALWMARNLTDSRIGRAFLAIKGSEVASQAMGINTARLKLQVFVLSAVLAGIAGALYAHYVGFISPAPFSIMTSVMFVVMAVVGGPESIWGVVVGSAVVTALAEALRAFVPMIFPMAGGEYQVIVFGALLMGVLIFMPEGIVPSLNQKWRQRKAAQRRFAASPGSSLPPAREENIESEGKEAAL